MFMVVVFIKELKLDFNAKTVKEVINSVGLSDIFKNVTDVSDNRVKFDISKRFLYKEKWKIYLIQLLDYFKQMFGDDFKASSEGDGFSIVCSIKREG